MKEIKVRDISTNIRENGVLEIYVKGLLAAEISDGRDSMDFVIDVLEGMDYSVLDKEFEKRPTVKAEDKYTFSQSSQISAQCGLIGYLRADMDTNGNGFFSTWNDWRKDLKTDEFKAEFDRVINSLREEGDILYNRTSLAKYCYSTPQAKMNTEQNYYGIRLDTDKYAYLMRLNPDKGEYNLYCYCYIKDWLNDHIRQAERGIRFIDPNYNELFRIPDGDRIRITFGDGEVSEEVCRYIDDYHMEVGSNLFHICDFAERMEENGCTVIPLRSSLPEYCYSTLESTGELIIIRKGENNYYRSKLDCTDKDVTRAVAEANNQKLGVTKAQEEAMKTGSMFGWTCPGADPKNYDKDGNLIPSKNDRGDER